MAGCFGLVSVHFVLSIALSLIQAHATVLTVNNGTDFVNGVYTFCQAGGEVFLQLNSSVVIAQNIPFPSGGYLNCVQPGRLVLNGAFPSGQNAVLDAAMRSDLTLPWNSQSPTLVWQVQQPGLTGRAHAT